MIVLLLFFCSGATALVYEVLWSKYLSLLLGSTVQAQTVVLAVFMGGLALGNRLFGSRSDFLRQPLAVYGDLELIIGIYGFLFPYIYKAADWFFIAAGTPLFDIPFLLLLLKLFLSAALLLPPTILMGGTLPLLAAWIERQPKFDAGSRIGLFYAVNSLGAVTGAGLAGLFMVQAMGMVASLQMTALANALIGAAAIFLSKRESLSVAPQEALAPATEKIRIRLGWPAVVVAITGGVSMGLEILSARSLALIVGGSLQAFALVLMAFILGIGLGSAIISSARFVKGREKTVLYVLLLSAGSIVALYVILIEGWVIVYSQARFGIASNAAGYVINQVIISLMALVVLGVPAALLGAVVPLSIRLLAETPSYMGEKVGRLLTWNTIGAVGGVLLTGFILMPVFGLRASFAILSCGLLAVVAVLAITRNEKVPLASAAIIAVMILIGVNLTGEGWRKVLGSGVFRMRTLALNFEKIRTLKATYKLLFYKDAADATVSIEQSTEARGVQVALRINGKADASSLGDLSTQFLCGHLPVIMRPDSKDVFILGFGSGITAGALLGHPIERLVIAENCQPVLDASKFFLPYNRGVLTNSRTTIRKEDARTVLKLSPQHYDVIISEPSNPWVVGVGSVFSKEYYELAASRLKPGGVMSQWFHVYEMHDQIVFLVLRTFAQVFPYMEIWDTQNGDLILLGSKTPWESNPSVYQKVFEREEPRSDLEKIGITSGVSFWSRLVASQRTAFAISGDGPTQSDEFPVLEYAAPRAFFLGQGAYRPFFFDERTKQFPLMPPAKLAALRALPTPVLLQPFQFYSTSNPDLRRYLEARQNLPEDKFDPLLPVAFRSPASYPPRATPPTNASPQLAEFLHVEAAFLNRPEDWEELASAVEAQLEQFISEDKLKMPDFRVAYYAALAARYAMGHDDYMRALRLLRLGFIFDANDEQLQYLSRVLDRIVPPEVLKQFEERAKEKEIQQSKKG